MTDIYYPVVHRSQEEINASRNRYDSFDTNHVKEIFSKELNKEVITMAKPVSWSTSHIIYFVTVKNEPVPYVFRGNNGSSKQPETYLKVEQLATDMANKIGVPVNKILYVDISRKKYPFDFQIQEMLEGKDLEKFFKGTQADYDRISIELGEYIAKMSEITFNGFGRFDTNTALAGKLAATKKNMYDYVVTCLDDDIRYLADTGFINAKAGNLIRNLFEEYQPVMKTTKGSLVQHDMADHNILFKNNHLSGILDWEACVSADPVLEIASCPTWKTIYPRQEKLIQGFKRLKKLPGHFQEKMDIYRLRTMLWKAVFALKSDFMNESRRQKFVQALQPFNILL